MMSASDPIMYRQGDILLTVIDRIPSRAKLQKSDVILMGEVTGHAHRLKNGKIFIDNSFWKDSPIIYIDARNGLSYLSHEEHKRIDLQASCYIVTRQREYEPKVNTWQYYDDSYDYHWISD